jgi:hypothetical protein
VILRCTKKLLAVLGAGRVADRSVLGCVNDMAFLCEVATSDAGGLAHFDLGELNHALPAGASAS